MKPEALRQVEIFRDLDDEQISRLAAIARFRSLRAGERLFILGDNADRVYVVMQGRVDLCFPFSLSGTSKDVRVESKLPGSTLGWSALVKPYRFTLSARAAEATETAAFLRQDLLELFEADPRTGYVLMKQISEVVGSRLLKIQALWAREIQRAVTRQLEPHAKGTSEHGG